MDKSGFDNALPATFDIQSSFNLVANNTAAGSQRLGFNLVASACGTSDVLTGNTAHSSLVGLMLRPTDTGAKCTQLTSFATYLDWDFGIFTVGVGSSGGSV